MSPTCKSIHIACPGTRVPCPHTLLDHLLGAPIGSLHPCLDAVRSILMENFVYAGKVAVATWGAMNWKDETLKMIIAIPSTTIGNLLGLKLSEHYYLKVSNTVHVFYERDYALFMSTLSYEACVMTY